MGSDGVTAPLSMPAGEPAPADDAGWLRKGAMVGRYVVLDRLGSGGAGSVHAAYDTQLDRRVALKVLHDRRESDDADTQSNAWKHVVREARILGRLSHPNVVTVFDVDVEQGVPFIAMELVEGPDLAAWLNDTGARPETREILERFVQAARGLAAAHGEEIVHGDFKPANCLIGRDGRVRVSDFGLARGRPTLASASDVVPTESAEIDRKPVSQTDRIGEVDETLPRQIGTPYYMAPEQHLGEAPTRASDVYSFCLALAEAVSGEHVLRSSNVVGLAAEKLDADLQPRLAGRLPRTVREVVEAGLRHDATRRPQTMAEIRDVLERALSTKARVRWAATGVVVAATAGTAAGWYGFAAQAADPCTGFEARAEGVWDPARKAALASAFETTELGARAWPQVQTSIDGYTHAWFEQRTDACQAHRSGVQSDEMLDRRSICLDRRWSQLEATLDVLATAEPDVVRHARGAVAALPAVGHCADTEALLAEVPWPEDGDRRARVDALYTEVAEVEALVAAGKAEQAHPRAEALVHEAREVAFDPLLADALIGLGGSYIKLSRAEQAYDTIREAHWAAIRGGYARGAVETAADLVFLCVHFDRADEAKLWEGTAAAHLGHVGEDLLLQARLEANRGRLARVTGEYAAALEHLQRAVDIRIEQLGPDEEGLGSLYAALGDVAIEQDDYDAAVRYLGMSRENKIANLDRNHPSHAVTSVQLGIAHFEHGDYAAAEREYGRALDEFERSLGPEHPAYGEVLYNLGNTLAEARRPEEAKTVYQRAYELYAETMGERGQDAGMALLALGKTELDLENLDAGLELIERARAILTEALGADHPYTGDAVEAIGDVALARKDYARALEHFEAVLAQKRAADPPNPRSLAYSLVNVGRAHLASGQTEAAAQAFAEALEIRETQNIGGRPRADAYYWLARARHEQGHLQQARTLMQRSHDIHLAINDPAGVRRANTWLQ